MATTDPIQIATSLCSKLKLVKEPTSADVMGFLLKIEEIVGKLPEFFISIRRETNPTIKTQTYIFSKPLNERYILVLGQIANTLGVCIYTKEILEEEDTEPKQALVLICYQPEFIIMAHIIKAINHFKQGMRKKNKLFEGNKTKIRASREREYLNSIYESFKGVRNYSHSPILKKRFNLVLHEVIKMHKFEYKNNEGNPQYGGKLIFKNIITKGKWKKHKLLWS